MLIHSLGKNVIWSFVFLTDILNEWVKVCTCLWMRPRNRSHVSSSLMLPTDDSLAKYLRKKTNKQKQMLFVSSSDISSNTWKSVKWIGSKFHGTWHLPPDELKDRFLVFFFLIYNMNCHLLSGIILEQRSQTYGLRPKTGPLGGSICPTRWILKVKKIMIKTLKFLIKCYF